MRDREMPTPRTRTLLVWIRRKLELEAVDDQSLEELRQSGWEDVWIQATCFYWRIYLGPRWIRLTWYHDIELHGMEDGTLHELLQHVFRPRAWNRRLAIRNLTQRSRGERSLVSKKDNGWIVIG